MWCTLPVHRCSSLGRCGSRGRPPRFTAEVLPPGFGAEVAMADERQDSRISRRLLAACHCGFEQRKDQGLRFTRAAQGVDERPEALLARHAAPVEHRARARRHNAQESEAWRAGGPLSGSARGRPLSAKPALEPLALLRVVFRPADQPIDARAGELLAGLAALRVMLPDLLFAKPHREALPAL